MRSLTARLRRHRVGLALFASLLLIYALLGFLLVPHLARSAIQQQLAIDGRQVHIGSLRFNPFSLDAQVEDFALTDAKAAPLLAFKSFEVNAAVFASIWHRSFVLQEVSLLGPYLALVREADGSINLSQLLPPSKDAKPSTSSALPRIRIDSLVVDGGKLDLKDLSHAQPFATSLSPIRFSLKDFRTESEHDNVYQFSGTALTGEQFEWSGAFTVQPLGSSGRFALKNLQAKTIDAYLQSQLPMRLVSGVGELSGSYQLSVDPKLTLDLQLPALTVRQFAVAERAASDDAPPLAIAELGIQDVTVSLAQRSVRVKRIEVKGAKVNAQREPDGSLNLMRLLPASSGAPPAAQSTQPAVTTAAAPSTAPPVPAPAQEQNAWRIGVDRIDLADAAVVLDDRAVTPTAHFSLNPIKLGIDGYSTAADAKPKIEADLQLEQGGQLYLAGDLQLQPLSAAITLKLQDFELPLLQAYLAPITATTLKSGRFGGEVQVHYVSPPNQPAQLSLSGDLNVADFDALDPAQQEFVKWHRLDIGGIDFSLAPQKLAIDRVALDAPYARVVIEEDRSLNVAQLMTPQKVQPSASAAPTNSAAKAQPSTATKPMPIRINTVSIVNGSANFADRSIAPQFATAILGLAGKLTGLSSDPASRAKLHFEGHVDKYWPVVISGKINPLAAAKYADVDLSFRNMDLTTFNPYSGRFAGYNIVKGKLTTELKYKIQDRALDAQHHVIVDQLEFGAATGSKQAVPLPVRLAVSLLKDRNGVIDLELPVRGSLDDPSFSVGPVIWKVFVNLLTKVVTAPFAAIGALFGGGDELSYIDFAAGSATLGAAENDKLGKLAAALAEHPQLRLDVPLALAAAADRRAAAHAALDRLMPAANTQASAKDRLKALLKVYREQFKQSPNYPDSISGSKEDVVSARSAFVEAALIERLAPDAASLQQLAKDRAQAVQAAVLANPAISADRIFVVDGSHSAATENGAVRMTLKLE